MSIATLKKKTHASSPQWSLSRGHLGFALNGTIRPVGVWAAEVAVELIKKLFLIPAAAVPHTELCPMNKLVHILLKNLQKTIKG